MQAFGIQLCTGHLHQVSLAQAELIGWGKATGELVGWNQFPSN